MTALSAAIASFPARIKCGLARVLVQCIIANISVYSPYLEKMLDMVFVGLLKRVKPDKHSSDSIYLYPKNFI
jgi:hypothetical protein